MKKLVKSILLTGCFGLVSGLSLAQTQSRGEVTDQEFVIRKDRVLTVPVQPRVFERLPSLPQPRGLSDFNYTFSRFNLSLKPLEIAPEPAQKNYGRPRLDLYPGYVRAGYGNFASPLLEARYMATEVSDFNFAVQLNHQSFGKGPVQGDQSQESHSNFGFDGSYFAETFEVFGGLKWNQDKYSFYGVNPVTFEDPAYQTPDNVLNTIQFKAGIREIEKVGPFSYEGQVGFQSFKDSYLSRENELGIQATGKFRADEDWSGSLGLSYFMTTPQDQFYSLNRTYFGIRPRVSYNYGEFNFTAGINIVSENDSIPDKSSDFRIFPALKASYQFADEFGFYGEFSGDVQRNTYFSFVNENPFLGPSDQLLNTIQNYKIEGGIEGQFEEVFHYRGGINMSRYNHMHFFVNDYRQSAFEGDSSRFRLVYDDKTTVFNINAEVGFKFSDIYSLGSRLDLYQYSLGSVQEAWHRPTWELRVTNQLTPVERLIVQANLNLMGGLKGRGNPITDALGLPSSHEVVNLKTIADLQLKADYGITEQLSVFAEGNNLLNGRNTRWLNYPVRGVQLIGGLSFKF